MDVAMEQHPPGDEWLGKGNNPDSGGSEPPHPATGDSAAAEAETGRVAGEAADRLSVLTHELSGLLDGSLRWLGMVSRSLGTGDEAERVRGQLDTVKSTLLRMTDLVRTASGTKAPRFGFGGFGLGPTVAEAASHALDVVRPRAAELGITLGIELEPGAGTSPAGPLYSVILNGLRNSIESIEQALGGQPGEGVIVIRVKEDPEELWLSIEDDGVGPPVDDPAKVFDPGFSTRPGAGAGRGIGLSMSKQIVSDMGGRIDLSGSGGPDRRPGAVLSVRVPALASETPDERIGEQGEA